MSVYISTPNAQQSTGMPLHAPRTVMIDLATLLHLHPVHKLRRHVLRGTAKRGTDIGLGRSRESKVDELHYGDFLCAFHLAIARVDLPVAGNHAVLKLEVPVTEAVCVEVGKRGGDLLHQRPHSVFP